MARELVRRAGTVVRSGGKDVVVAAAAARSTAGIAFGGERITWQELPGRTRRAAWRISTLVAEAVEPDDRERIEGGSTLRYATGWRAYEDAVVLAQVARPVLPGPGGGGVAVGPWQHRSVRTWKVVGRPRRRKGVVDVADELDGREQRGARVPPAPVGQERAADAWTRLPKSVRTTAERIVPAPLVWLGELSQLSSEDRLPLRQEVVTLRMTDERAVVVVASRELTPISGADAAYHEEQMARVPWLVELVGLEFGDARENPRLEAGPSGASPAVEA